MNEQTINQNSPEVPKKKGAEIIIGILIVVIIVLIAVGFYFLKKGNVEVQTPASITEKTVQPEATAPENMQAGTTVNQTTQSDKAVNSSSTSTTQTPVDFNYELKQLDSQVGSISTTDLNDSEMTDAKAGL